MFGKFCKVILKTSKLWQNPFNGIFVYQRFVLFLK